MRIITLWEPWSSLLAISAKTIETRGWSTDYAGPVAIHSAKGGLSKRELFDTCTQKQFWDSLMKDPLFQSWGKRWRISNPGPRIDVAFNFGHIIAVGNLVDCLPTETVGCLPGVFDDYPSLDTPQERAFGNYDPGRYGLVFENMRRLATPVPFKSRQGKLLDLDAATETLVLAQL